MLKKGFLVPRSSSIMPICFWEKNRDSLISVHQKFNISKETL